MDLYYYFENAVPDKIIDKIIEETLKIPEWTDATIGYPDGLSVDSNVRKTRLKWINPQWLYDYIWPFMEEANTEAGWNFGINECEYFQFGLYDKGSFYDWHMDGNLIDTTADTNQVRKISLVVWLNEEFDGGNFVIKNDSKDIVIKPSKGTILMFPSYYLHKVEPVIQGSRYSLVSWFIGDRIR